VQCKLFSTSIAGWTDTERKLKQAVQSRSYEAFSPVAWIYGSISTAVDILLLFCFVVQNFLPEYNFYLG